MKKGFSFLILFVLFSLSAVGADSYWFRTFTNVWNYTQPSGEFKVLDLTEVPQKSTEGGYFRPKEVAEFGILYFWADFLFFMILLIGMLIVKMTQSMDKNLEPELEPAKRLEPIQLLLPYSGQLLTTEALDQILGIDELTNFDSKRMKRARMVRDINEKHFAQAGKELIVRDKKPEDKRYVYYKIQA